MLISRSLCGDLLNLRIFQGITVVYMKVIFALYPFLASLLKPPPTCAATWRQASLLHDHLSLPDRQEAPQRGSVSAISSIA